MPGSTTIVISHSLACSSGYGVVSGSWTSESSQDVTLSLVQIADDTNPGSTTPLAPVTGTAGTFEFPSVVDGLYYVEAVGSTSGSTTTDNFTIDCFTPLALTSVTVGNDSGASDGTATVNTTGGVAPLSFSLDNATWQASNLFTGLAAGDYTAYVKDSFGTPQTAQQAFTVTGPAAGAATPPAAKYMAVGGTLPNPIEYTFAFQPLDSLGAAKTGHYVIVNIYREGELTPFATTRQRVRNGAAKVDVSRFVKSLVSPAPGFDSSLTVTTDPNAMAGFTIGFVEAWAGVTMEEVKENTVKYAVNAALQSLDGNYVEHVILAS